MFIHWNGTLGVALLGCGQGFQVWVSVLSTYLHARQVVVAFSWLTWAGILELKSDRSTVFLAATSTFPALGEDWLRWSLGSPPNMNSNSIEQKDDFKKGECWRVGSPLSRTEKSEEHR